MKRYPRPRGFSSHPQTPEWYAQRADATHHRATEAGDEAASLAHWLVARETLLRNLKRTTTSATALHALYGFDASTWPAEILEPAYALTSRLPAAHGRGRLLLTIYDGTNEPSYKIHSLSSTTNRRALMTYVNFAPDQTSATVTHYTHGRLVAGSHVLAAKSLRHQDIPLIEATVGLRGETAGHVELHDTSPTTIIVGKRAILRYARERQDDVLGRDILSIPAKMWPQNSDSQ